MSSSFAFWIRGLLRFRPVSHLTDHPRIGGHLKSKGRLGGGQPLLCRCCHRTGRDRAANVSTARVSCDSQPRGRVRDGVACAPRTAGESVPPRRHALGSTFNLSVTSKYALMSIDRMTPAAAADSAAVLQRCAARICRRISAADQGYLYHQTNCPVALSAVCRVGTLAYVRGGQVHVEGACSNAECHC